MIKTNRNIKPQYIFGHDFLYTPYADETTFFIRKKNSVIRLLNVFDTCKIKGIDNLKGVYVALCDLKFINLMNETVKIIGCHFSYNRTLQQENHFKRHISKIENVLKVWRIRHLTLEGKINVFNSLAVSNILHLAPVTPISTDIINLLNTIQKNFSGKVNTPKSNMKLCLKRIV